MGNYPDETSAREEIGRYIDHYNHRRPHQALMNFTPGYVHQINNKTVLRQERQALKQAAREQRRQYWFHANQALKNTGFGMDQGKIVEYGPTTEGTLKGAGDKKGSSHSKGKESPQQDSQSNLVLSH